MARAFPSVPGRPGEGGGSPRAEGRRHPRLHGHDSVCVPGVSAPRPRTASPPLKRPPSVRLSLKGPPYTATSPGTREQPGQTCHRATVTRISVTRPIALPPAPAQRRCDAGRSRPPRLCCSLILRALSGSHCFTSLLLGAECSEGRSSNPSVDLNIEGQSSEATRIYLRRKRRALWEAPVQAEAQECSEGETEAGGVFEEGEGTGTCVGGRRCYQCRKGHTVTLVLSAVFTFPSRGCWSGGNRSSGQCCFRPSPKAALSCPNIRKVGGGTRASQALGDGSSGAVLKWLCLFVCFLALKVKNPSVK